jgi:hypothetical protein
MRASGKKASVRTLLLSCLLILSSQGVQGQEGNKPQPGRPPEPGEAASRLDNIERKLGELQTGLKNVSDALEGVKAVLETYDLSLRVNKNTRDIDKNTKDIQALRDEIDRLQRELGKAQAGLSRPEPRRAMSPAEPVAPARPTLSGQVELINDWLAPVSVFIDDLSYPLQPGERRIVAKPAGGFSYEVVGTGWGLIRPRRNTTLATGETLTIRVAPR